MICIEQIYMECVKPERNKCAYYRLVAGRDLFGFKLIRSWGRLGTKESPRHQERFINTAEMEKSFRRIIKKRLSHGYTATIKEIRKSA